MNMEPKYQELKDYFLDLIQQYQSSISDKYEKYSAFARQLNKTFDETQQADIVLSDQYQSVVLDTKWKCLNDKNPSIEDLRQLYTYHHYYEANKVALVYPSADEKEVISGEYAAIGNEKEQFELRKTCSLLFLHLENTDIRTWQQAISAKILAWMNSTTNTIDGDKKA